MYGMGGEDIKTTGAVMIVMGSFLWGCIRAHRLLERLKRLKLINQSLLIFETQMDYALMSIPECFEKIGHTFQQEYIGKFYYYMADKLRKDGTYSVEAEWKNAVVTYMQGDVLTEQDCELIGRVGEMPLYLNKQIQLTMIRDVRTQIDSRIMSIEKECGSKCKIYRISGLAVGVMCLLLLI